MASLTSLVLKLGPLGHLGHHLPGWPFLSYLCGFPPNCSPNAADPLLVFHTPVLDENFAAHSIKNRSSTDDFQVFTSRLGLPPQYQTLMVKGAGRTSPLSRSTCASNSTCLRRSPAPHAPAFLLYSPSPYRHPNIRVACPPGFHFSRTMVSSEIGASPAHLVTCSSRLQKGHNLASPSLKRKSDHLAPL